MSNQNNPCKYPSAGIDWGSSSFRAYLFDEHKQLVDTISTEDGIKSTPPAQFETILFRHIGHWLRPGSTVILSGMITSRYGWTETPYIPVPAKLDGLLANARTCFAQDVELIFLPGLSQSDPRADVIRGEELLLFGATQHLSHAMVVMPGTHSKWATVSNGTVTAFQTIITGELFDALLNNTLLGQLAVDKAFNDTVFNEAVKRGFASRTLMAELFQSRSGVLLGQLKAQHVYSYLSGLLIGNEIREALQIFQPTHDAESSDRSIIVIGSDMLCERYQQAFSVLQLNCTVSNSNTASDAFSTMLASTAVR